MPQITEFQEIQALQLDVLPTNVTSGSGYVVRRIAIEDIGGMPENTVAEDWVGLYEAWSSRVGDRLCQRAFAMGLDA